MIGSGPFGVDYDPMADDFELLDRWREGDRAAGNTLFERHFGAVYRFFRNKASDALDDLTQRTFLACAEHRDAFEKRSTFRTYLFSIARNELYAHIRRARGRERLDVETETIADLLPSARQVLAEAEEHRRLLAGLCRLPIDYQLALELHYWEGLTVEQIAVVLDVPLGTAKSRLRRGRTQLARIVAEIGQDEPIPEVTLANLDRWSSEIRSRLVEESQAGR
jgi:RNA polymerase sigma factor (sigma-70 family)